MGGGMSIEMWRAEDDNALFRSELQQSVFDEFAWEPMLDVADIGVTVDDHIVTLSGAVKTYPDKLKAERAARRVRGVQAVRNNLAVVPPACGQRSDREIAKAAGQVLDWNVLVPRDAVRATVGGGWVRLAGEVSADTARRAALAVVARLIGVRGIVDDITIRPTPAPVDLKASLAKALQRCASLHGDDIEVATEGGAVVLRGCVRTLAERDEAESAVWALPGVASVRVELQVER
jgi:osmotically-inducible protein OsmY